MLAIAWHSMQQPVAFRAGVVLATQAPSRRHGVAEEAGGRLRRASFLRRLWSVSPDVFGLIRKQFQVLYRIVGFIAVFVVNDLFSRQRATQVFRHHEAVDEMCFSLSSDNVIAEIIRRGVPAAPRLTFMTGLCAIVSGHTVFCAAKCLLVCDFIRVHREGLAARDALDGNLMLSHYLNCNAT
jgi:hypothetical protein